MRDLGGIARDRHQIMPLLAQIDIAFDQAQLLVLGTRHITLARAVGPGGNAEVLQMRQAGIPQRTRGAHVVFVGIEPRHLPVPTR